MSKANEKAGIDLSEALHLLEEAATEKKQELKDLLAKKYQHLGDSLKELEPTLKKTQGDVLQLASEVRAKGEQAVKTIDEDVHERPWAYLLGAGVVGLCLGALFSRR